MINPKEPSETINYCLYARKSSESDERQAMSIDSQIKEMKTLAKGNNLNIKEVYKESHSAKTSGTRPMFNQLLQNIRTDVFTGILTWAPDRLSRNAGDLGMLVDLMDQKKLLQIKTYSQNFSNTPNEKFLLMILCSQAKLENDQKGINVKRGIRAKCEMGWRPGPAPIGYYNRSFAGTKDIVIDPDRGHFVTEMFEKVANGNSGRMIKKWADKVGFANRSGRPLCLSQVYRMLKDTFYLGKFEYPMKSGIWYQGSHKPLITKKLFSKVQIKLVVPVKAKWRSRDITFRCLFKCASCQSGIVGEIKYRKIKYAAPRKHIYYHCGKSKDLDCREPYLTEKDLITAINKYIDFISNNHPQIIKLPQKIIQKMETYKRIQEQVLLQEDINPDNKPIKFSDYAKHILLHGTSEEKREIMGVFNQQLYIHNKEICSATIK